MRKKASGWWKVLWTVCFSCEASQRRLIYCRYVGQLLRSSNSGDSWTTLHRMEVRELWKKGFQDSSFSGLLYIGSGDASLAILSPNTYMGDLHKYYQWNGSSQHIENIKFNGKDVYYLVSHTPNPGIYLLIPRLRADSAAQHSTEVLTQTLRIFQWFREA